MQTQVTHADRLAAVIRDEAARIGMTITKLAEKTGLKRPYISLRLNGHRGFTVVDLDKIGGALGTPAWELMYRARAEQSAELAATDASSDGFAIQDKASGSVILQARRVDWEGGDAA